jgi:hypothetical protein
MSIIALNAMSNFQERIPYCPFTVPRPEAVLSDRIFLA